MEFIDYSQLHKIDSQKEIIMKLLLSLLLSLSFCNLALAEGKSNGGGDFRNTAAEYQDKANHYADNGKYDIAALYQRLSEIKLDAASKADKGKWEDINWSEYHEVNANIAKLHHHKK